MLRAALLLALLSACARRAAGGIELVSASAYLPRAGCRQRRRASSAAAAAAAARHRPRADAAQSRR